jgi:hypothetical protein
MSGIRCEGCGAVVPDYDVTHCGGADGGYRDLCTRCYNEEVARIGGLPFAHVAFTPVDLIDVAGAAHQFHFGLRHLGDRLLLEAFEVEGGRRGGYEFQIVGDADDDPFELMRRLVERMRRALARRHLGEDEFNRFIAGFDVRGRITWDPGLESPTPMLVIDGREVSWDEFGRMLMMFEGWQFRLEIKDPADEC